MRERKQARETDRESLIEVPRHLQTKIYIKVLAGYREDFY